MSHHEMMKDFPFQVITGELDSPMALVIRMFAPGVGFAQTPEDTSNGPGALSAVAVCRDPQDTAASAVAMNRIDTFIPI